MPSQRNITQLETLKDKLRTAKAVVLSDYSGLPVGDQEQLRKNIRDAGGEFLVAKNRIFKLAFNQTRKSGVPSDLEDVLQGPTAFLFAYQDEIGPIKAMVQFAQAHELPKTKLGLILIPEDRVLSPEAVVSLALLPSREILVVQLIAALKAPRYRLVNVLSANLRKLTVILKAIQVKKGANLRTTIPR